MAFACSGKQVQVPANGRQSVMFEADVCDNSEGGSVVVEALCDSQPTVTLRTAASPQQLTDGYRNTLKLRELRVTDANVNCSVLDERDCAVNLPMHLWADDLDTGRSRVQIELSSTQCTQMKHAGVAFIVTSLDIASSLM